MKRSLVISACLVIAVLILAAVAAVAWRARDRQARVYSDGDTINVPVKTISPRQVLWQPPMPLPGEINTEYDEYEPRIDAREQSIHFVRGKAGSNADIWFAQRSPEAAGEWNAPQPLTSINTTDDELGPELSRDGQLLLFYSNRSGGSGGYDIWVSRRSESGWQAPVNLGPAINSEHDEYSPALSPDGTRLYFASNRPQPDDGPQRISQSPWHATVRQDRHRRDFDLYMAIVEHGEPRDAAAIAPLNTTFNEGALAFSPAGDFLYFCSDRPGGKGGFDLYRSRYLRGERNFVTGGDAG